VAHHILFQNTTTHIFCATVLQILLHWQRNQHNSAILQQLLATLHNNITTLEVNGHFAPTK
jgi:hypothetical protein